MRTVAASNYPTLSDGTSVLTYGYALDLSVTSGGAGASAVYAQWAPVPLPASTWLLAGGLGLVGWTRRRRVR